MSTYLNSDPPVRDKRLLQTSLVCPKGHALESIPASSLMNVPLFYTLHGFVCSRCEISSDNLVDQTANLCYDCGNWIRCSRWNDWQRSHRHTGNRGSVDVYRFWNRPVLNKARLTIGKNKARRILFVSLGRGTNV
eukprot:GEMP01124523.1.p1 GENE.GEMP01124523.1~~GEMP01124523.1.p1  ORF type:complete len:135 (+),score=11.03 GEMP01124523.1:56-460(+)